MRGYKILKKGLINRYGFIYELNKKYYLNGKLDRKDNGFYFCGRIEDTFRYVDGFNDELDFTEVEAGGEIITDYDDYNEYYDIYASTEIELIRIIPRIEMFNSLISSKNPNRVKRMIETLKLERDEISIIKDKYPELDFSLNYYQNEDFYKKMLLKKY